MSITKLTQIANKHFCDKGTKAYEAHGYTEEYDKYIPSYGKYNLLEIGIWHGDSIRMWNDYNSDLEIYGIDIDPNVLRYIKSNENIHIHIGNQADETFLSSVVYGNTFDFIIDDGSHKREDIISSLSYLYDVLNKNGFYFIEDIHAQQAEKEQLFRDILDYFEDSGNTFIKMTTVCNDKLIIIEK